MPATTSELFQAIQASRAPARIDDAFDGLIETLETVEDEAAYAIANPWTADRMREFMVSIRADLGYCIDQVYELKFLGDEAIPGG